MRVVGHGRQVLGRRAAQQRPGRHRPYHLQDGQRDKGAAALRQALAICQRIGSPCAQRVHPARP